MGLLKQTLDAPRQLTDEEQALEADEAALAEALTHVAWESVLDMNARELIVRSGLPYRYRSWEWDAWTEPRDSEWMRANGCPRCGGRQLYESLTTGVLWCSACHPGNGLEIEAESSFREKWRAANRD